MKKCSLFKYLFIFSFIFLFQCSKKSVSIVNNNQCSDIICNQNLNDFLIRVSVSMTPYDNDNLNVITDFENYFGVLSGATSGYDTDYDILESPNSPGNWISLYFPHPEWEHPLGDNFTQDILGNVFLNEDNKILDWQFNIESNSYGTIQLNFETLNDYCYDCIKSIQLIVQDEIYTIENVNFNDINISRFLEQNQILSFNLLMEFN